MHLHSQFLRERFSFVQISILANGILSIGKTMSSKILRVQGSSTFGNPFTFIGRYSYEAFTLSC